MSSSLQCLAEELSESCADVLVASSFRRFLVYERRAIDLLVRCAKNIDEQVSAFEAFEPWNLRAGLLVIMTSS